MNLIVSLFAGLVFGLGLIVSGMANPAKVLAFLDLAGPWDPSLMLVMGGAIAVGFFAFRLAARRSGDPARRPVVPAATGTDRSSSAVGQCPFFFFFFFFGIGWVWPASVRGREWSCSVPDAEAPCSCWRCSPASGGFELWQRGASAKFFAEISVIVNTLIF